MKRVSDHVYAAVPKKSVRLISTSSIIIGSHFITVVEAQTDEQTSRMLLKQIRSELSTLPIRYLLLTHYHIDHTLGAGAFLQDSPDLTIVGSPELNDQLKMKALGQKTDFLAFIGGIANKLKEGADSMGNNEEGARLLSTRKEFLSYYDDISHSQPVYPQLLIRDTLRIWDGALEIKYFPAGASHTPADLAVYIPSEKVLISGDLVHDFQPLVWGDSNVKAWVKTLEEFEKLDIKTVVGGHGRPKNKEVIGWWKDYLVEIISMVDSAKGKKMSLAQLQEQVSFHSVASLLRSGFGEEVEKAIHLNMDDAYQFNWEQALDDMLAAVWKSEPEQSEVELKIQMERH